VFVGDVVGELEFVERDRFAHPLFPGGRRVRVDVHALGHLRVSLSSDHPARVVELVAAVVDGNDVHQHDVFGAFVQSRHFDFERWKHPPIRPHKLLLLSILCLSSGCMTTTISFFASKCMHHHVTSSCYNKLHTNFVFNAYKKV